MRWEEGFGAHLNRVLKAPFPCRGVRLEAVPVRKCWVKLGSVPGSRESISTLGSLTVLHWWAFPHCCANSQLHSPHQRREKRIRVRSPPPWLLAEGEDNPLQYSCLGKLMDRGPWRATVLGVARVRPNLLTKPPPPPQLLVEGSWF